MAMAATPRPVLGTRRNRSTMKLFSYDFGPTAPAAPGPALTLSRQHPAQLYDRAEVIPDPRQQSHFSQIQVLLQCRSHVREARDDRPPLFGSRCSAPLGEAAPEGLAEVDDGGVPAASAHHPTTRNGDRPRIFAHHRAPRRQRWDADLRTYTRDMSSTQLEEAAL